MKMQSGTIQPLGGATRTTNTSCGSVNRKHDISQSVRQLHQCTPGHAFALVGNMHAFMQNMIKETHTYWSQSTNGVPSYNTLKAHLVKYGLSVIFRVLLGI